MTRALRLRSWLQIALCAIALLAMAPFVGCERKEKVLDVETPGGEVEVERNIDTGRVDVEVRDN
jgi:hypothetical protein